MFIEEFESEKFHVNRERDAFVEELINKLEHKLLVNPKIK